MPSYTSPDGADLVFEGWAFGSGGYTWDGAHSYGGGGGAYGRKKITGLSIGDVVNIVVSGPDITVNINGGATIALVKAGAQPAGGAAAGCTGCDVAHSGGHGGDGQQQASGAGGAGATRDAAGGNGTDGTNAGGPGTGGTNDTPPNGEGGNGLSWFQGIAVPSGTAPGGGGGGLCQGNTTAGAGAIGASALWKATNWNGNPTTDGTSPVSGASPVVSSGTFQPAPAAVGRFAALVL